MECSARRRKAGHRKAAAPPPQGGGRLAAGQPMLRPANAGCGLGVERLVAHKK